MTLMHVLSYKSKKKKNCILTQGLKGLPRNEVQIFKIVILSLWRHFDLTFGLGCVAPNCSYRIQDFQGSGFSVHIIEILGRWEKMMVAPHLTPSNIILFVLWKL